MRAAECLLVVELDRDADAVVVDLKVKFDLVDDEREGL